MPQQLITEKEARDQITATKNILDKAPDYLDLKESQLLIGRANNALELNAYKMAYDFAVQAKENAMKIREKYLFVVKEIDGLEKRIEEFRKGGVEIEGSSELIRQIKAALIKNDFDTAITLINRNKDIMDNFSKKFSQEGKEAQAALEKIYTMLKQAPEYINLAEATVLYTKAKEHYTQNDFISTLDFAAQAQKCIFRIRDEYMNVVNQINQVTEAIEKTKEAGYNINLRYVDEILENAKQDLVNNDFSMALEKVKHAYAEIENAKEPLIAPLRDKVNGEIEALKTFVYNLRGLEVDVSCTEPMYKEIQQALSGAKDIKDYEGVLLLCEKLRQELVRIKAEKERMDEFPKTISARMRDIKQEVGFLKTNNVDVHTAEEMLSEAVQIFSTAEEEDEYKRVLDITDKIMKEIDSIKEASKKVTTKKQELAGLLHKCDDLLDELTNNKYDTKEFETLADEYNEVLLDTSDMEALMALEEQIKDFVVTMQEAIEESRKLLGLKQTAINEVQKLQNLSSELVELEGDIKKFEGRIRTIVKSFNEFKKESDLNKIIKDIDDMMPEIKTEIDILKENKKLHNEITVILENLRVDLEKIASFTDTTEANDIYANAKELFESKDYKASLSETEKCRQVVYNLQNAQPQITIKIDTESLEPNKWAQTNMVITNNGKAHAKNIVVSLEGPIEIRKLKPIAALNAGEEYVEKIGVKFQDRGEVPLDVRISCLRTMDSAEFNFNTDYWAAVGITEQQKIDKPLVTIISPTAGGSFSESAQSPDMTVDGGGDKKSAAKPAPKAVAAEEDEDVVKRMQKLNQLKQLGLISEEEYELKRKELLSKL